MTVNGKLKVDVLNITSVIDLFKNSSEISDFVRVHEQGFILEVPLPSIGSAGEHLSIAEDLLQASCLAESLARSAKSISYNRSTVNTYFERIKKGPGEIRRGLRI